VARQTETTCFKGETTMTTSIFRRAALGAFTIAAFTASLLAPAAPVAAQTDPFRDGPYEAPCTACPYDDAARDYVDSDLDGLLDLDEGAYGTDAFNPDTDSDGLPDGDEVNVYGTNPTNADTDGDGFSDGVEVQNGTDPHLWDDDSLNDTDDDGLLDYDEGRYWTSPYVSDSDGDGLGDGDEVFLYGTVPTSFDTDGDGRGDGAEVQAGTDPLALD
jgi:hypothetical protein